MKKLFLVATLIAFCATINAQGLKGTWFAGGAVEFSKAERYVADQKVKTDAYEIMPLVGNFINPSVAVGGALGYKQLKDAGAKDKMFTIMPLVRKYWNITGNLYVFGQAALPVGFGDQKDPNGMKTDLFSMNFQFSPGFDLIVNEWFTIEASFNLINAGFMTNKPDEGKKTTNWSINGNSIASSSFGELTVGVKFLF